MGTPFHEPGGRGGCLGGSAVPFGRRALLVALVLVGLVAAGATSNRVGAEGSAVVDADLLNLRAEPGTWSAVVGQLGYGEPVAVLAGPTADGWYQVQAGERSGWAHGWFLLIDGALGWSPPEAGGGSAEPAPPAAVSEADPAAAADIGVGASFGTAWVVTDGLAVRTSPAEDAGVVGTAGWGDAVTVTGAQVDGYVPVDHWSGSGWVWGEYLDYAAPASAERWADVNRTTSMVTLYEGGQAVASYWGAMGSDSSDAGFFATAVGTYYVYEKYADLSWTVYGQSWVSDWVAFDPSRFNGFHSFSMDASGQVIPGGDGPTGGCVALAPWAADHVFAFLHLGSRVEVHW